MKKIFGLLLLLIPALATASAYPVVGKKLAEDITKPVIILVKTDKTKTYVLSAVFPDGKCVSLPGPEILSLPHEFRLAPKNYTPCGPLN